MTTITRESIALRNVKVAHHMSQETTAFTASLYIAGKKAAIVRNYGRGGDNWPHFTAPELREEFFQFCNSLPSTYLNDDGQPMPLGYDSFIGDLLEDWMENDDWKRICKKHIAFKLTTHGEDEYSKYPNQTYTPFIAQHIRERYGSELVEIINERFTHKEQ